MALGTAWSEASCAGAPTATAARTGRRLSGLSRRLKVGAAARRCHLRRSSIADVPAAERIKQAARSRDQPTRTPVGSLLVHMDRCEAALRQLPQTAYSVEKPGFAEPRKWPRSSTHRQGQVVHPAASFI